MKKSPYLVLGVVMLGIVMRAPFTSIPALLTDIAVDVNQSVSSLGLLTSLPVLMFALCSAVVPGLAGRFGLEKTLGVVLILMTFGSGLRVAGLWGLYLGTVMIGIGIAFINVLLPSFVTQHFSDKISFYTTLYVSVMGLSVTVLSMVAAPLAAYSSWQIFVCLLTILLAIAAIVWLPNWRYDTRAAKVHRDQEQGALWKSPAALAFLFFGGLQSIIYYTEIAWLSTLAQDAGLSTGQAGIIMGVFSLIGIPVALVIPGVLSRLTSKGRAKLMLALSAVSLLGLGLMLWNLPSFLVWLLISLCVGVSAGALFPYMMLSFSLKTASPQAAARLSGMVQSGGYLLAAIGPSLLGQSYQWGGSWSTMIWILMLLTVVMMGSIILIEKEDIIGA